MPSLLALALVLSGAAPSFTPERLWNVWPSARFVTTPAPCLDHATLVARLGELEARHAGRLSVEGPPSRSESLHLDAVLDALTRGRWRSRVDGQPLSRTLRALTGCLDADDVARRLAPAGPASFILLQEGLQGPAAGPTSHEPGEANELALGAVFIDGREPLPGER